MIERRCEAGVAVATRNDLSIWPDLETDLLERTAIFLCGATGKENSGAINLLWQLSKNHAQTLGRREAKIRWGQFSLVNHVKFPAGIIPTCRDYRFYDYPGGFRAAAFDPENALAGFHHFLNA